MHLMCFYKFQGTINIKIMQNISTFGFEYGDWKYKTKRIKQKFTVKTFATEKSTIVI